MIKANLENLIETAVVGTILHPEAAEKPASAVSDANGRPTVSIVQGGITLNVRTGDSAFNWAWGDRVMPGVALRNGSAHPGSALATLSCIGNEATVIQAALDGKDTRMRGQKGVVIGKNTSIGSVNVHFSKRTLEKLCIGDRIQIRACGQGLSFPDFPEIAIRNCSPRLFKAVNPTEKTGTVRVHVTSILPGKIMASGIANDKSPHCCMAEIQSSSTSAVKEYKLGNLRLGDLVAITDFDLTFGPRWHDGAVSVGVVVHGASTLAGRGPGITCLFTSAAGKLDPIITRRANLSRLFELT